MKAIAPVSAAARNTVRKYVRDSASNTRMPRASRLDPHRDWLIARLAQSPGIPATVLQRELQELVWHLYNNHKSDHEKLSAIRVAFGE